MKISSFRDAAHRIVIERARHEEANVFIKREPKASAEIYRKLTNDRKNSADDPLAMIADSDIDYITTPANLMKHVTFMHRVGRPRSSARGPPTAAPHGR